MPPDLDARLARAAALELRGELDAAICAYLDVLVHDRYRLDAMLSLGALFAAKHAAELARAVFAEAATFHSSSTAYIGLGNALLELGDRDGAHRAFDDAVRANPNDRDAHMHLALVLEREDNAPAAEPSWRRAYPGAALAPLPFRGTGTPVRLMAICSALGGNAPLDRVIDPRVFQRTTLFAEGYRDEMTLPDDALLLNAIADADLAPRALDVVERMEAMTGAVALNRACARARDGACPERCAAARAGRRRRAARHGVSARHPRRAARRLRCSTPPGSAFRCCCARRAITTVDASSTSRTPRSLRATAASLPGDVLLAIEFIDVRGDDRMVRKYRVLTIGGELYPLHLALSHEWKVHYFSAAMDEQQRYRDEERAFLEDMRAALGAPAVETLRRIAAMLGAGLWRASTSRCTATDASSSSRRTPPW